MTASLAPECPKCGSKCQDDTERRKLRFLRSGGDPAKWQDPATEWWCNTCGMMLSYAESLCVLDGIHRVEAAKASRKRKKKE